MNTARNNLDRPRRVDYNPVVVPVLVTSILHACGIALKKAMEWLCELADGTSKTIAVMPRDEESILHLRGIILAPKGSLGIEDYILFLNIDLPPDTPFRPPRITFETKMWHPRIGSGGNISWDVLDMDSKWRAKYTLELLLATIQYILVDPVLSLDRDHALNFQALHQYDNDRSKYVESAKDSIEKSTYGGYGKVKFEDHRISCIQATLRIAGRKIKYECSIYCQSDAPSSWKLMIFIIPNLAIYREHALQHIRKLNGRKVTSFSFDFADKELMIDAPDISKDECWTITPSSTLKIKKDDCIRDPRKHGPSVCEFKLDWVRPEQKPQRFIEKIKLIGCETGGKLYITDICIDPQNTESVEAVPSTQSSRIDLRSSYRQLLPMAFRWPSIGCLLNLPNDKLTLIRHDHPNSAEECLQEMLATWLRATRTPTWTTLAEAVEPFHPSLAETLKRYD